MRTFALVCRCVVENPSGGIMKILLLSGVNLNMLGRRDPKFYGTITLPELELAVKEYGAKYDMKVAPFRSNSEGELVDILQRTNCDAVIFNAGAYSHYSYALRDCIECLDVPVVETHLSDIYKREEFRHTDVLADVCAARFYGNGVQSYFDAVDYIAKNCKEKQTKNPNKLVLVGFACAGKTTVGKLYAEKYNTKFVDTDSEIERRCGMSVGEIFAKYGEEYFRKQEAALLADLPDNNCVISCGGGTPTVDGFAEFAADATVIWLKVSAPVVNARLGNVARPLFDGLTEAELAEKIAERNKVYMRVADFAVDTDMFAITKVRDLVFEILATYSKLNGLMDPFYFWDELPEILL